MQLREAWFPFNQTAQACASWEVMLRQLGAAAGTSDVDIWGCCDAHPATLMLSLRRTSILQIQ